MLRPKCANFPDPSLSFPDLPPQLMCWSMHCQTLELAKVIFIFARRGVCSLYLAMELLLEPRPQWNQGSDQESGNIFFITLSHPHPGAFMSLADRKKRLKRFCHLYSIYSIPKRHWIHKKCRACKSRLFKHKQPQAEAAFPFRFAIKLHHWKGERTIARDPFNKWNQIFHAGE